MEGREVNNVEDIFVCRHVPNQQNNRIFDIIFDNIMFITVFI